MKTKYTLFNILFTVAMLGILAAIALPRYAQAQTTNPGDIIQSTNVRSEVLTFLQDVSAQKSISVAVYPSYAPDIKVDGKRENWGAGIALLVPATVIPALEDSSLASHAFGGLRFDMLGKQFFASTVAVGLKGDFQIYKHNFTIFGESGVNIPLAGSSETSVGGMVGTGISTTLFTFGPKDADENRPGIFGLFAAVEKWTQFSGYVGHFGLNGTYRF